jgi:serine/threonine protein kinase
MNPPDNDDDKERTIQSGWSLTGAGTGTGPGPGDSTWASDLEPSGDRLPVGSRLAEFEITGFLGEGGFSLVYLAWDHSLERRVALKEYMPSSLAGRRGGTQVVMRSERHRDTFQAGLKSFINEGKLLASFNHPSLVKVYRFWEANGTAYMVMPYYEGVTLKETLRAMGSPPDEAWLRTLLAPLTEALLAIHKAHCYHRDIAPDNILLLASSGKPVLLDFGAARRVIGDRTQSLTVILKPGYAPVEQYAEDPGMKQGPWTDVYALAAVVYWAITGKTPPTSVGRLLHDNHVPLSQCASSRYSARFLEALDRALQVLPAQRTQSIERLREEIGIDTGPALAPIAAVPADPLPPMQPDVAAPVPATTQPSASARPRRIGLAWGAGGVTLLLLIGALWWAVQPSPSASPSPRSAVVPVSSESTGTPSVPAGVKTEASVIAAEPVPRPSQDGASAVAAIAPPMAARPAAASGAILSEPMRTAIDQAALDRALKARAKLEADERPRDAGAPSARGPIDNAQRPPRTATSTREASLADERQRAAQPVPTAVQNVQQLCSDRSNFVSENLCQTRACRKAEYAADPTCVRLNEIEQARQRGGQQ